MHSIICLSKSIECIAPRVNPNVNSGLWIIMMYQCRFINCRTCTILVGDADIGGGSAYVGMGGIWEISVPSAEFCCEPKTALKIKSIKLKKIKGD